jgi:hypothetical protein
MTHNAALDPSSHPWHDGGPISELLGYRAKNRPAQLATEVIDPGAPGIPDSAVRTTVRGSHGYDAFTVNAFPFGPGASDPSTLLGNDPDRRLARIVNAGAVGVLIGKRSQVSTGNGFLLPAGIGIDVKSDDEVFAVAASGTTPVPVSVWVERN